MNELLDHYLQWLDLTDTLGGSEVLASWEFVPLTVRGELAGIAMLKGTEVHFAAAPTWRNRVITRMRARAFLAPLMDRYGFLTTRSLDTDEDSAVFLLRLGFVKTWTELGVHHWMLTALPFTRS